MRTLIFLIILCFTPLFAQTEFDAAGSLYDEGKFTEALEMYQSIEGQSAALDYNRGNTLMRLEKYPEAIVYYRRALWQKPADPDIRANLERALEKAGAAMSPLPLSRKLSGFLNAKQWQWGFIASCWLIAGLGLLRLKLPAVREASVWIFPLTTILAILLGLGVWASLPSAYFHEAVIKPEQTTARFEPLPDATERFVLPGGTVVTLIDQSRRWHKISAGNEEGWVPAKELILLENP